MKETSLAAYDIVNGEIKECLRGDVSEHVRASADALLTDNYVTRELAASIANVIFAVAYQVRYGGGDPSRKPIRRQSMPDNHTYRWAPIGAHSPTAAAAASLAVDGLDPELALRLAPVAVIVDDIDHATPVNPAWPGIHIVDDVSPPARPLPAAAFVLELVDGAAKKGGQ